MEESRLDAQNVNPRWLHVNVKFDFISVMYTGLLRSHYSKLMDYSGFDQWGSIIGQIMFKDEDPNALYLRGLCQRRWGKHEFHEFYQTVTFLGVTTYGAMYCIGVSKTRNSFSQ